MDLSEVKTRRAGVIDAGLTSSWHRSKHWVCNKLERFAIRESWQIQFQVPEVSIDSAL